MKTIKKFSLLICCSLLWIVSSCRKDFLDAKPSASLVVPASLEDFQAILDNIRYMNGASSGTYGSSAAYGGPTPMLLEVAADNYYVPDYTFNTYEQYYKNVYLWNKDNAYGGIATLPDWSFPYRTIFYSNVVLDGLKNLPKTASNEADWNRVKGCALFFRAWSFYHLAQAFAPFYEKDKAKDLLGLPLRLSADISEKSERATLEETYAQIFSDLNEASTLLTNNQLYKTRPSLPATFGLLARIYLSIEDYSNANVFAKKCLDSYGKPLLNYNNISSTPTYPFVKFNDEVIFSSIINSNPNPNLWHPSLVRIDSVLYASYHDNDLRKSLFFRLREPNAYSFRGCYDGGLYLFCGLAVDEIQLILAESQIRLHNVTDGINSLNLLMKTRYRSVNNISTFTPYATTNEEEALRLVLTERRKELIMRGLRLPDLRRLNKDPRFAVTLYRKVNNQIFTLPPNDLRYTWPIPDDVIALTGMQQNPR